MWRRIMKKNGFGLICFAALCLLMSSHAHAQNKLESWYTYWGLGYVNPQYPDELENALNLVEDIPGSDHISVGLDLLGFYWPVGDRTIIGGILNAFGDRYEVNDITLQINGYTFSFSAMHYLTNLIGQGLFLRGEIGPTRFAVDFEGVQEEDVTSDWGIGGLVGAGFGIPVSSGTRILLNVNYAIRRVEGETVGALGITVGGLF